MNQNHYSFCNFTDSDYNQLKEILKTAFEIEDFKQIKLAYDDFKSYYLNGEVNKGRCSWQTLERKEMKPRAENKDFINAKFNNTDYFVGIDLPILFKPDQEKANGKFIFILAEDPLRNEKRKEENDYRILHKITLSTPFGLHIDAGAKKRKSRVVWNVAEELLMQGYAVYFTDINKVWIKKAGKQKEKISAELQEKFRKALELEIKWIKPEKIIAFGNPARDALNSYNIDFSQKFFYPHTAARAEHWLKLFSSNNFEAANAKNDTKLNFIMSHLNL